MGKYSDINVYDVLSTNQLRMYCRQLRRDIAEGRDVDEVDIAELCTRLEDKDFFDLVKTHFPLLCSKTDVQLREDNHILQRMKEASNAHRPSTQVKPQSEDYSIVFARVFYKNLASYVFAESMDDCSRTNLAIAFAGVFEAAGAPVPEDIENYIKEGQGALAVERRNRANGARHRDAGAQAGTVRTETGVYNGGNTCYQNTTFRLFLSSDLAMQELFKLHNQLQPEPNELQPGFHLLTLFQYITTGAFVHSKAQLRKMWDIYQNSESQWRPGVQQDMCEFLVSEVIPRLEEAVPGFEQKLKSLWSHVIQYKEFCGKCDMESERVIESEANFVFDVVLESRQNTSLAHALNGPATTPQLTRKDCSGCGKKEAAHGQLQRLFISDGQEVPDLLVSPKRFSWGSQLKVRSKLTLPPVLIAVAGTKRMYYIKYLGVHIGPSIHGGHYLAFERGSPAEQLANPSPQRLPDDATKEQRAEYERREQQAASNSFVRWTRYEDNVKTTGLEFSEVQKYEGDWYLARLAPASRADVKALIHTLSRRHVLDTFAKAYEDGVSRHQFIDPNGPSGLAVLAHLRQTFDYFAGFLNPLPADDGDPSESFAKYFGLNAFCELYENAHPPSSQNYEDMDVDYDLTNDMFTAWQNDATELPRERARLTANAILDKDKLVDIIMREAGRSMERQSDRLTKENRRAFIKNLDVHVEAGRKAEEALKREQAKRRQEEEARQRVADEERQRLEAERRKLDKKGHGDDEESDGDDEHRKARENEQARQRAAEESRTLELAVAESMKNAQDGDHTGTTASASKHTTDGDTVMGDADDTAHKDATGSAPPQTPDQTKLAAPHRQTAGRSATTVRHVSGRSAGATDTGSPRQIDRHAEASRTSRTPYAAGTVIQDSDPYASSNLGATDQDMRGPSPREPTASPSPEYVHRTTSLPLRSPSSRRALDDPTTHSPRPDPATRLGYSGPLNAGATPRTVVETSESGPRRSGRLSDQQPTNAPASGDSGASSVRRSGRTTRKPGSYVYPLPPLDGPVEGALDAQSADTPQSTTQKTTADVKSEPQSSREAGRGAFGIFSRIPKSFKNIKKSRSRQYDSKPHASEIFGRGSQIEAEATRKKSGLWPGRPGDDASGTSEGKLKRSNSKGWTRSGTPGSTEDRRESKRSNSKSFLRSITPGAEEATKPTTTTTTAEARSSPEGRRRRLWRANSSSLLQILSGTGRPTAPSPSDSRAVGTGSDVNVPGQSGMTGSSVGTDSDISFAWDTRRNTTVDMAAYRQLRYTPSAATGSLPDISQSLTPTDRLDMVRRPDGPPSFGTSARRLRADLPARPVPAPAPSGLATIAAPSASAATPTTAVPFSAASTSTATAALARAPERPTTGAAIVRSAADLGTRAERSTTGRAIVAAAAPTASDRENDGPARRAATPRDEDRSLRWD